MENQNEGVALKRRGMGKSIKRWVEKEEGYRGGLERLEEEKAKRASI